MADMSGKVSRATRGVPKPPVIRAYHGSPHDFDRFDASKIGTGEGNQSFGHGLYFAGSEDVAKHYRDSLRHSFPLPMLDSLNAEHKDALRSVLDISAKHRNADMRSWPALQRQADEAHARLLEVQHRMRAASDNPGKMYEVEIGHPESSLFNYAAPMGQQPEGVLAAADRLKKDISRLGFGDDVTNPKTSANTFALLGRAAVGQEGFAKALRESGVPGAMYLDGFSRQAGQGTSNYVMFPGSEDSIRILRKYGILAPVAAGAAQQQQQPSPLGGLLDQRQQ